MSKLEIEAICTYFLRLILIKLDIDDNGAHNYFSNETFEIRGYDWHDENNEPNFRHKKSDLRIEWYKHIGHGMEIDTKYYNPLTKKEYFNILEECLGSI